MDSNWESASIKELEINIGTSDFYQNKQTQMGSLVISMKAKPGSGKVDKDFLYWFTFDTMVNDIEENTYSREPTFFLNETEGV